jgi:hypothetical protein
MRIIDKRSPTSPLVAIGGDLRASLTVESILPEAINRLTAALERVETPVTDPRLRDETASHNPKPGRLS